MEYLLLIYDSEAAAHKRSAAERQQEMQEYGKFMQEVGATGAIKGGNPLELSTTATTVRVRIGKTATTDGPFAETKEQLGGYFLIEAKSLDDAIAIAAKVPTAKYGSIEVRPVMKINM